MLSSSLTALGIAIGLAASPVVGPSRVPMASDVERASADRAAAATLDGVASDGARERPELYRTLAETLAEMLVHWLAPSPKLTGRALYESRLQPEALNRFWLLGTLDQLWHVATLGIGPAPLGAARYHILTTVPVTGEETSQFGYRRHPISKRRKLHRGLDYGAPRNTPVHAAGPGEVLFAGRKGSYGNVVIISHGLGLETRYAHLRRVKVKRRQFVDAGTLIGTVGTTGRSTGPHLHFEVRQFGEAVDPKRALGMLQTASVGSIGGLWSWLDPR